MRRVFNEEIGAMFEEGVEDAASSMLLALGSRGCCSSSGASARRYAIAFAARSMTRVTVFGSDIRLRCPAWK